MKKIVLFIFSLSLIYANQQPTASPVETAEVTKEIVNPLQEFSGTLRFSKISNIASQTNGNVLEVLFQAGQKIKKDETLAVVDSAILDAQIRSAKASLESSKVNFQTAKKDYLRYEELLKSKAVSQKIYDESYYRFISSKANYDASVAKLDELKVLKSKKNITAPFDGVAVEKNIEKGEWVSEGKTVAVLVNTDEIDMIFNLPGDYVYKLNKEQPYKIKVKDITFDAKLYSSIPKGDVKTRTFPVKFKSRLDQDKFLFDGMQALVNLPRDIKKEALTVPRDAVIKRFNQDVVFLEVNGSAVMIPVRIIGYTENKTAIEAEGINQGAKVVVKGNERIFPNQPIVSLNK